VRVVAPAPGETHERTCQVTRVPSVPFPFYPEFRLAWAASAITRLVQEEAPDAAVVLTSGMVGMAAVRALPQRTRLVHIYTTDVPRYLGAYSLGALRRPAEKLLRWMSDRGVATFCPTETVRSELAARGHQRLEVWGRGVDTQLFHPRRRSASMRLRLTGGEPEKPLVLYAGRLAREKRLLDLYQAARRLPDVRFALVGNGPQCHLLERVFSNVPSVFTGYLRGETLAEAIASADLFAFPSDTDTFGQVVLQAMACGVPPVVVGGTAPAELVPDGKAGVHVSARDPQALAGALADLIHDAGARIGMARAASEHAVRFSWPALIDRLEATLTGSCVTPARPPRRSGRTPRQPSPMSGPPARP
jgi:phosphatidylinositol alpha 1,6-mannosyltransferase